METKAKLIVLDKDAQKAVAVDIFKRYPKAQNVSVASDGQAFITDESDSAAKNHAKVNRYGKKLSLTPFTRDELDEKQPVQKTALEVIALIEAAKTGEEVATIAEGDTRKTVLAAVAKKLETLNTPE